MLRNFFAVLLAGFIVLTISEFVGAIPSDFGSVGKMNDLLGVLAIFFLLLSFGAMAWPAAVNRVFQRPLKREYKRIAKQLTTPASFRHREAFYDRLTRGICTADEQADTSPARLLAVARQNSAGSTDWPWDLPELAEWAQSSEVRLRTNIVVRFLLSDRLSTIVQRLDALRSYALSFPTAPPGLAEQHATLDSAQWVRRRTSRALSSAIESHTGASVLATGLHTRAGVDTVRLWHSDGIMSQDPSGLRSASPVGYEDLHLGTSLAIRASKAENETLCTWERTMKDSPYYVVGDRDNHVPIVDGVTVSENRWAGTVEFVLSTHSSCMAATDHSPFACKGQAGGLAVGSQPLWKEVSRVVKRDYTSGSALESNLATHVVVMITDESNERHLVLVRRGNTYRFGNQMLTVPGTTLSLAAGGRQGFTDAHGAPDLLQYAISGAKHSLGLILTPEQLRPSHVIMVNQRESEISATAGRSQLVCTVGYTASVAASREDIEKARAKASRISQHGVQSIEFLPFGKANVSDVDATVESLLDALDSLSDEMDQMSSTATLIVAARLLGPGRLTEALAQQKNRGSVKAWWQSQWPGETGSVPRNAIPLELSRVIPPSHSGGS